MDVLLIAFVVLLALKTGAELILEKLNRSEVKKHAGKIPEVFEGVMDQETYDKATRYTLVKNQFGMIELIYDAIVSAAIILCFLLPALFYFFTDLFGTSILGQAGALFGMSLVLSIPSLPGELWNTFRIEAEFGFNKSTVKLWVMDKIKGFALAFAIGMPMLALILWLFESLPNTWWLWGFFVFFGFQLLMLVLYPRLIIPIFNKLEPLPEGSLRDRLLALGERTGFTASTIHVMDGSKRSGHSNAFFTGFGKFRRIVLYDTLVEQLTEVELESVLAHEIGHYKRGHVPKMLIMSAVSLFLGFAAIGWTAKQPWVFEAFGFNIEDGMVPAMMLFTLMSGLATFWLTPLMNRKSRKHEYEADAFAVDAMDKDPEPLVSSLRKMYEKNLSNLTPHPLYSAFHYSHPTLVERESSMREHAAQ